MGLFMSKDMALSYHRRVPCRGTLSEGIPVRRRSTRRDSGVDTHYTMQTYPLFKTDEDPTIWKSTSSDPIPRSPHRPISTVYERVLHSLRHSYGRLHRRRRRSSQHQTIRYDSPSLDAIPPAQHIQPSHSIYHTTNAVRRSSKSFNHLKSSDRSPPKSLFNKKKHHSVDHTLEDYYLNMESSYLCPMNPIYDLDDTPMIHPSMSAHTICDSASDDTLCLCPEASTDEPVSFFTINSRTTSLHHLYRNILGGDYIAPLKRPKMILDIEPRGGEWMQAMSLKFPHTKIVGCSGGDPKRYQHLQLPSNCHLIFQSPHQPLYLEARSFDYIHQRALSECIPEHRWFGHLKTLYQLLRPGGYIELVERDVLPTSMGPCTEYLAQSLARTWQARGCHVARAAHLVELLKMFDFEDIYRMDVQVPIDAPDDTLDDHTFAMAHHALVGSLPEISASDSETPSAQSTNHVDLIDNIDDTQMTENEFNALVQTVHRELSVNRTFIVVHVYWARKRR